MKQKKIKDSLKYIVFNYWIWFWKEDIQVYNLLLAKWNVKTTAATNLAAKPWIDVKTFVFRLICLVWLSFVSLQKYNVFKYRVLPLTPQYTE